MSSGIQQLLESSSAQHGDRTAVVEPGRGSISYRELDRLAGLLRDRLVAIGVQPGCRVGFYLPKSIDSVISIYGILKTGAAYVPVDPTAPPSRNAYIFGNCEVAAIIVHETFAGKLQHELDATGYHPPLLCVPSLPAGDGIRQLLDASGDVQPVATVDSGPDDLAYILYTSGSTGRPKGVMLTQENALSFLDWCSDVFRPVETDRISSHAPLHFDLSILDVHMTIKHGATLVLVDERTGKDPASLAPLIANERISIWYSAPSILAMLAQYGELEKYDYSELRKILFAGEVFPVRHLVALKKLLPHARYYNLYGPTETNVCTYYEIPPGIDAARTRPYPIGRCCSHLYCKVIDEQGHDAAGTAEGELVVRGAGVTHGYWNLDEQTRNAFHIDADGERWYRTGDIVIRDEAGDYEFLGRRDRMIKKRGYRIELGEIESCLYRHPDIKEAGVIAVDDVEFGVRVKAFIGYGDGKAPSIVALKAFCAERLPPYMVPDLFALQSTLPRTSTDKVDYQKLKDL